MEIRAAGPPCVCRVDSKRTVKGLESNETRYYISSRGPLRAASPLLRNLPYERFAFFGAFGVNPERALKVKKMRRIMMWDDTMLPRIIVGR